jgi:UDP-glucuronate decarboxylase
MRILLSGAAGFLGSNLADKLLLEGHTVIGLDDLSTGRLLNIEHLASEKNFDFIEHDIREPFSTDVDAVLNLACPASPVHYQSDPVKTIETNFLGMVNMLKLAKKNHAVLVQASTSEVYGDPTISPQVEEYWGNVNPIGIRACYDEGKRSAETLCFDYLRQHQVDSRVVRIFNTYGPRMAVGDGRVVSNFIVQALQNQDITIYGDGLQTRSFCFVEDLIHAIYKMLTLDKNPRTPINIGNPIEFTMLELAAKVIDSTNSKSNLIFEKLPSDDPRQRKPDISKAKMILDWTPITDLESGIKITADYFKKELLI